MKQVIYISIIPRSSKNEITGPFDDGSYKVRITAPPVDGAANKKLIEMISEYFSVAKTSVTIVKGEKGRKKIVEIEK